MLRDLGVIAFAVLLAFLVGVGSGIHAMQSGMSDRVKAGVMVIDAKPYRITPMEMH